MLRSTRAEELARRVRQFALAMFLPVCLRFKGGPKLSKRPDSRGELVSVIAHLGDSESLEWMRTIPGHGCSLRLGARQWKRKYQRLGSMVRDVPGHMMIFLMDMAVEHCDVLVRGQDVDCFRAILGCPVPFGIQIKEWPVCENDDRLWTCRSLQLPQTATAIGARQSIHSDRRRCPTR